MLTPVAVCFTCTRDVQPLDVAVRSVRTAFPGAEIWLSIEEADVRFPKVPDCVHHRVAGARGNLNGLQHLQQAFALYAHAMRVTGARRVFKFDSDTVVLNWPQVGDHDVVGVASEGRGLPGIFGAAYCLSAKFVDHVVAFLSDARGVDELRHVMHLRPDLPEDLCVWQLALLLQASNLRLPATALPFIDSQYPSARGGVCAVLGPVDKERERLAIHLRRPPSMLELGEVRANLLHACLTNHESPSRS